MQVGNPPKFRKEKMRKFFPREKTIPVTFWGALNLWPVILPGDFIPDFKSSLRGALKYWHVIPTGAFYEHK